VLQTDETPEISALRFAQDGLTLAVGTSTGHVLLYDLRNPIPRIVKDHQYGYPIKSIHFHDVSEQVVSADTKSVKIWSRKNGKILAAMEPPGDVNDVLVLEGSGMVMVGNESTEIQSYYVPSLGPAPRWCAFLENLTEEMEETNQTTVYDDYKFVTAKELAALGLDHMIGTDVLRAYMHGYFIDLRLYEKARQIANPFAYEEFKKKRIQEKIEQERATRISAKKKLPKVNRNLAQKLLSTEDDGKKKKVVAKDASEANPLGDARFANLFQDPDFQVDEESHEFLLHHPDLKSKPKPAPTMQAFQPAESESEAESDFNEMASSSESEQEKTREKPESKKEPKMYQLKKGVVLDGGRVDDSKLRRQQEALGDRVRDFKPLNVSRKAGGNISMSFKPSGSDRGRGRGRGRGAGRGGPPREEGRERRGVKDLGFKKHRK